MEMLGGWGEGVGEVSDYIVLGWAHLVTSNL